MRDIAHHLDLHFLKQAGQGFITDGLSGKFTLHRVNCLAINTLSSKPVQLKFFETCPEATQWLNDQHHPHWLSCAQCAPTRECTPLSPLPG
jgi:hypothetical protein